VKTPQQQSDNQKDAASQSGLASRPFATPESAQQAEQQTQSSSFSFVDIGIVQPKMTVGTPNDPLEQEADTVARQVVDQMHSSSSSLPNDTPNEQLTGNIQRTPLGITRIPSPLQRAPLQRSGGIVSGEVNSDFESQIGQTRGSGSTLQPQLRGQMESAMGASLGNVRVHTDTKADQLSQSIQAKAFTTGSDIYFKKGEYNPSSRSGQELIAHEVTHTIQQGASPQMGETAQRQTDGTVIQREPEAQRISTQLGGSGSKDSSKFSTIQKDVRSYNTRIDFYNELLGKQSTLSPHVFAEQKAECLQDLDKILQKIAGAVLEYLNKRKNGISESVGLFTGNDKKQKILANRREKLQSIKDLNAELINITKDLAKHKNPQSTNTSDDSSTVNVDSNETQDVQDSQEVVIKIVSEVKQEQQLESQQMGGPQPTNDTDSDTEDSVSHYDLDELLALPSQDEQDNGDQDNGNQDVPQDDMTYLYQDITSSNPCLWMNWNSPNIRIVSSFDPGQGFEYFNQFCVYLSVYWVTSGMPQSLSFTSLDDKGKKMAADKVCELLSGPAQTKYAMSKIGGQQVDPKEVKQKIANDSYAAGTTIWYGNPRHAQTLYVEGPNNYANYDPDLGTRMFLNANEWLNWVNTDKRGAVDVCVVREA